jgi:UDP-N-acetylmuramate dehydrogenase
MEKIVKSLISSKIEFKRDVDLSKTTYLKTGGTARLLILPKTTGEIVESVKLLKANGLKYKVIGATSNLMFLDNSNYSCLLSTIELKGIKVDETSNQIISGSGEMIGDLSRFALLNSITGFEGLEGIPGTVGGAVFMNAGAYGYETKSVLNSIEIVDENGNIKNFENNELGLKYRNSALKKGIIKGIIISASFKINFSCPNKIEKKMELYHAKRHKYQEWLFPNLGSCFSGSIYRVLGKKDPLFKVISMLYFLINYKFRLFRRESPINRTWINDIAIKRFNLKFKTQPFSNKNINTLVNRGQGTDEMLRYIETINFLTDSSVPLENEILESF